MRSDRSDQDTVEIEPGDQRIRYLLHCRGDQDAVEQSRFGRYIKTVANLHLDIVAVEALQPRPRGIGQRLEPLQGQHLPTQPGQHRGLVTGSGPDLEHAMLGSELSCSVI